MYVPQSVAGSSRLEGAPSHRVAPNKHRRPIGSAWAAVRCHGARAAATDPISLEALEIHRTCRHAPPGGRGLVRCTRSPPHAAPTAGPYGSTTTGGARGPGQTYHGSGGRPLHPASHQWAAGPCLVPKKFSTYPSHQIFRHMHRALNTVEKNI